MSSQLTNLIVKVVGDRSVNTVLTEDTEPAEAPAGNLSCCDRVCAGGCRRRECERPRSADE